MRYDAIRCDEGEGAGISMSDRLRVVNQAMALLEAWFRTTQRTDTSQPDRGAHVKTKEEIFYDAMLQRIDWQLRSADALDTKIATWFTLPTLILPVVAGLLIAERDTVSRATVIVALCGIAVWLLLIIILYIAYSSDNWDVGPSRLDYRDAVHTPEYTMMQMLFDTARILAEETIPRNERLLRRKSRMQSICVGLFVIETALFSLAVLMSLKT